MDTQMWATKTDGRFQSRLHPDANGHASARTGQKLQEALARRIRGDVRFDAGSRAAYARDSSNYRQIPIGVICPRDAEDCEAAMEVCRRFGVPILGRGGGTSLAGQCCNAAVVFDFSRYMNRILKVNPEERWARVQPGLILDDLQAAVKPHDLCFGPDPSTHSHCTFGGMIGNNSCGVHSLMAGRTVDNVHELEVLTYDGLRMTVGPTSEEEFSRIVHQGGRQGEIYARLKELREEYGETIRQRFPRIPRRVSGYCLDELLPESGFHVARSLVGTESTCAMVLQAKVQLVHSPRCRCVAVLCYKDIYAAADHVPEVLQQGPIGLEAIDNRLIDDMHLKGMREEDLAIFPQGYGGWLLVEFGGDTQQEANGKAHRAAQLLHRGRTLQHAELYEDYSRQKMIWEVREAGLGATAFVPTQHDTWPGWEDSAVHPDNLGDYLRELRALLDRYHYACSFYGHFGDGLLHTRIDFELRTRLGLDNYRDFVHEAADLVNKYGGSYSGEHGDGQSRGELLSKMYGDELIQAFREFKALWDPRWKMNPGKVIDAYPIDSNLALGTDYRPPEVSTHFSYPEDDGDFHHATLRCVGVGRCRREEGGTMCPSYMVTRDEKHTTRGRARILYEMLQGDVITDGWQSEEVKEALDLCLACKGCKGECPVHVDMATYKAEFLSHYYEQHARPRYAWSMGLIDVWARLVSMLKLPKLANALSQSQKLGPVIKGLGGVSQRRSIPAFAAEPFTAWYKRRSPRNLGEPTVLLWPDTFNNYFEPEIAKAAVEVLEYAGFHVTIPRKHLCCGRPLYDYGLLDRAKEYLRNVVDALAPEIEAGIPVIGLEPSCLAVFRDELTSILPDDEHARRLSRQCYSLTEFLNENADQLEVPHLKGEALVHGHCHQKALWGVEDDREMLARVGVEHEVLDSGCCGLAGSFGFEEGHFDVSRACGERVLLPRVRSADEGKLIIADGFSCREQIQEFSHRHGLHMAQVLQMAIREGHLPAGTAPERGYHVDHKRERYSPAQLLTGAALVGIGATAGWWLTRKMQTVGR